jgi:hypothetical protein
MLMAYQVGDLVRCTGTIEQTDGTNIDPSVVKSWFRSPSGTVTIYTYGTDAELVKSATGIYYMDVNLDTAGDWHYGFYSTGTGQAASVDTKLTVDPSRRSS